MTIYPKFADSISIGYLTTGSDWKQITITYYDNFDIDTGNSLGYYALSCTCHKTAISLNYSTGYLEINIHGKKYFSFNNEWFTYDGANLIPFDGSIYGPTLANNL